MSGSIEIQMLYAPQGEFQMTGRTEQEPLIQVTPCCDARLGCWSNLLGAARKTVLRLFFDQQVQSQLMKPEDVNQSKTGGVTGND